MTKIWHPHMVAAALSALGLAGCVAYEPAPSYYAPAPAYYYGPAPGPSLNFVFRGGDDDRRHHWH